MCSLGIDAQGAERRSKDKVLLDSTPTPAPWESKLDLNALGSCTSGLPSKAQSLKWLTSPPLNGSFYHQSQKNQQEKAQEGWNQDVKFWDGNVKPSVFSPIQWAMVECPWQEKKRERESDRELKRGKKI